MTLDNDKYTINIVNHELTKEDIIVNYQPTEEVSYYTYSIIKDEEKTETVKVENNSKSIITLTISGQYKIEFKNYYKDGSVETYTTGDYDIDKEVPVLEIKNTKIIIELGSDFNSKKGVTAHDNVSGDLTSKIKTNEYDLDFTILGQKELTYEVQDESGNITKQTIIVEVIPSTKTENTIRNFTVFGILLVILFIILSYYRSIVLEKRISKFSVEPKNQSKNLFEKFLNILNGLVEVFAEWLVKFRIVEKYSKRYDRYQIAFQEKNSIMIVAKKIIMSIFFFAISIFAFTIKLEVMSLLEMILSLLVGFYIIDFIYLFKYRLYRNNVENDLLQAIVVMNNAFKSGKNIGQAIEIVSKELDGGIALEFSKMKTELSMGLSVEVVFERFANRIEIDEVAYLTSSLMILNQTGGNIIKVFSSIEKSLMNKKKLRLEMRALTSSAKMVTYILMALPIIFVIAISIVSPDYFIPLIDNPLGILLLIIIVLIYLLYTYIVRIIMKVRM